MSQLTNAKSLYILDASSMMKYLKTSPTGELKCYTCGMEIHIGDSVMATQMRKTIRGKLRHEICARRVGLID